MNSIYKSMMAAGFIVLTATLPLSAQNSAVFTDSPGLVSDKSWGTSRTERYDVAVYLGLPQMEGAQVGKITFPWIVEDGYSDVKIWLSKELKVENKVNVPDILIENAVAENGAMTLTLAQPYAITTGGVYVGISFTMNQVETDEQKTPIATLGTEEDIFGVGFRVHTSSTFSNRWKDIQTENMEVPVFEVSLAGVAEYSATLSFPQEAYLVKGETSELPVSFRNFGARKIESLGIQFKGAYIEKGVEVTADADKAQYFGYPVEGVVTMPAFEETGTYDVDVILEEVNGEKNALAALSEKTALYLCSSRPVHRPLFEEYTGTGCGYCPRGTLGMDKLKEMYGDKFVGVAYHCTDIMSVAATPDYPNYAPAQPDAYIDRYVKTDPYFGSVSPDNYKVFGVDKVWEAQEKIFSPVHFSVSCDWADDSKQQIDVKSDFSFVRDYKEADFRVVYILVSNGLKGEGKSWQQGNYYSGAVGKWPEEFDIYVNAPNPMPDMTYDHVVICMPEKNGVEGSVPSVISADAPLSHSYSIDLADAVSVRKASLVQDKENIYVVAAMVDGATGHVLNSALAFPGVSKVTEGEIAGDVVKSEFFSVTGERIASPQPGMIFIEMLHYSDGTVKAVKRIR